MWRSEFLSLLTQTLRADLITESQALTLWQLAAGLFAHKEKQPPGDAILTLALERGISAYDAHFVVLARDLGVPLVTADRQIVKRCSDVAILIEDFTASH